MKAIVSPQLELLFSVLATGSYAERTKAYFGQSLLQNAVASYQTEIQSVLQPWLKHEIYHQIDEMIEKGFCFSRPVELMMAVSAPPEMQWQYRPSDFCFTLCGGQEQTELLLALLRDLAIKIDYTACFPRLLHHYTAALATVQAYLDQYPVVACLENFYGVKQNSYHCVISHLPRGNFGIHFKDGQGKLDLFSVFSYIDPANFASDQPVGVLSINTIFHEFSHPLVNPLTESHPDLENAYREAYQRLKSYKLAGIASGYGDWQECINEHMVRAIATHLTKNCCETAEAQRFQERDFRLGYRYMPALLSQLDCYEEQRQKYPTFADYYPELMRVFSEEII